MPQRTNYTNVRDRFTGPTPGITHDLNRAKVLFQARQIAMVMGVTPPSSLPDQCAESLTDHRNILRTAFVKGNEQ